MVGIVIVSHSAGLAESVVELAREMGGPDVAIEAAGGLEAPEPALGTDAMRVLAAIERADSGDGVLVLMDLGSAVLSAETALDLLAEEKRGRIVLSDAPLVEGAVAAAVTARAGAPLEQVAAEARTGLAPKSAHLGTETPAASSSLQQTVARSSAAGTEEALELRLEITNRLGLHARPAARFVQTASGFEADITVSNITTAQGPASARSLNALATLGVRQGHEILVRASGAQAEDALAALEALAERNFDEEERAETAVPAPAAPRAVPAEGAPFTGLPASPGVALAPVRHLRAAELPLPVHPADDPDHEWGVLQLALARVRDDLRAVRAAVAARAGEYEAAIFDAHLLFLEDEALLGSARRSISEHGRNAAQAWHASVAEARAAYERLEDEYMRARAEDLAAVGRQVLERLLGEAPAAVPAEAGIVVAPDLSPAQTAALEPSVVQGIATAHGGPTSHSAILARSLGLPAVVALGEALLALPEGTPLAIDGDAGVAYPDPAPDVRAEYEERARARAEVVRAARAAAQHPATTRDGETIEVAANVGGLADVPTALAAGADGIGLLRTEFLFLDRREMPDEEEQYQAYVGIARALKGRPLILRTLDVGADKPLPYVEQTVEANPFLGERGLRLGLARPDLLEIQLRAALRVAAEYPVKIMFPMVATIDEYRAACDLLDRLRDDRPRPDVGVMVEVPSVALVAEAFAPEVDFFSIGTNDLTQYTLAVERGNERVAAIADPLHPAVLSLIRLVTEAARAHRKWTGVCGELAGDALAAAVLIGLGVRELSVAPPLIPTVKEAVRSTDVEEAEALADAALRLESAAAVRELLQKKPETAATPG
jgi:phosphoenolpyruvate-protein phosphotransferase/dihydroxyacetone kinase phosphotransfer subunit